VRPASLNGIAFALLIGIANPMFCATVPEAAARSMARPPAKSPLG
jgi:hypothetical protein